MENRNDDFEIESAAALQGLEYEHEDAEQVRQEFIQKQESCTSMALLLGWYRDNYARISAGGTKSLQDVSASNDFAVRIFPQIQAAVPGITLF